MPAPSQSADERGERREPIPSIGKTKCDPSRMSLKRLDALSVIVVRNHLWSKGRPLGPEHACDFISHHRIAVNFGAAFRWTLAPVFLSRNVDFISQSHDFHLSKMDMC